jgi:hypothetical protein
VSNHYIKQVKLGPQHVPTGKTRHFNGTEALPPPAALKIAQYAGDAGYYLLYFDADGQEMVTVHGFRNCSSSSIWG